MTKMKEAYSENISGCDGWWSTAAPMIHRYGASVVFPIYDGHGNMVYTLSRGANETFSLGNKRVYGAWGDLRYDGNPNAGPNTQYCANLGHKKDGESGLTYMRARYYEPWTGRFVSEDPAMDGLNWYVYAGNKPVTNLDPTGRSILAAIAGFLSFLIGHILMDMTEALTVRLERIERYMAQLDELIAAGNTLDDWSKQQLALRYEVRKIMNQLKWNKRFEVARKVVGVIRGGLSKLLGYNFILLALVIDVELATEGFGSLEAVYGD